MLYTSQIPEIFNSTRKTRVLQHYWQKLRIQDVLFIYFEQFVSLFANFYSCFVKNQACFRQISQKRVICQIPSLVITTHCLLLSHYMNFWQGTLKRPSACQVWSGQKCDVLQLALSFGKLCHNATAHQRIDKKISFCPTCRLQVHFLHYGHHHRQEVHRQRCVLHGALSRQQALPLEHVQSRVNNSKCRI